MLCCHDDSGAEREDSDRRCIAAAGATARLSVARRASNARAAGDSPPSESMTASPSQSVLTACPVPFRSYAPKPSCGSIRAAVSAIVGDSKKS